MTVVLGLVCTMSENKEDSDLIKVIKNVIFGCRLHILTNLFLVQKLFHIVCLFKILNFKWDGKT